MSTHHLVKNAQKGNFEATVQVFLNYKEGAPDFEKNEELALNAFENAISILQSDFHLNELTVSNYKKVLDFNINLHKNLTVFLAENGVGKTSILEVIRKNLLWIAVTTRIDNATGGTLNRKDDVNNNNKGKGAYIDCEFQIGQNYKFKGRLASSPEGTISDLKSEYKQYRKIGNTFRILNDYKNITLPLFAYYGIERLPKGKVQSKDLTFGKIDGYDDSLNSKTTFSTFIEWLIQLLKLAKNVLSDTEVKKIESQIESFESAGANEKGHPLNEMYLNLFNELIEVKKVEPINFKAKKSSQDLLGLFKNIYSDLEEIQWIYEDNGNDKVALKLESEMLFLHQFSDGQRVLLGLIGDIARRLILLNDASENPFEGRGIVLIDEIDLHLHPSWQQKIILILRNSFPNIQFIVTTHSPHVITTVEPECIRCIYIDPQTKHHKYWIPNFTKGAESNKVLEDIFGVDPRPQWYIKSSQDLKRYTELVNLDLWDTEEALILRKNLDEWGKNKEPELDRLDIEISLRKFKRSKK